MSETINGYPLFYAAFSKDIENVESSSSGGIFFELCHYVIEHKGVVYGAVYTEPTKVIHQRAETLEAAALFRRSKYLRSQMGDVYAKVKQDLDCGRMVLFSGVGCQIAGLKLYLKGEYENLITCEVICHGAPLNKVMESYLAEREALNEEKVTEIVFRDKRNGWMPNSITEYYEDGSSRTYANREYPVHLLYLLGINMEKGCAACKYATLPRVADITLADYWMYWGSLKALSNNRGLSLVLLNSDIGEKIFNDIADKLYIDATSEMMARDSCPFLNHAPTLHISRDAFFDLMNRRGFRTAYEICTMFGDVVLADKLYKASEVNEQSILEIFEESTQEIVYKTDTDGKVESIVTFGDYQRNCSAGQIEGNRVFSYVLLSDISIENVKAIFAKSEKIARIPILDEEGKLYGEIRRTFGDAGKEKQRKQLIPFDVLRKRKIPCFFVQRPDSLQGYEYSAEERHRAENGLSFPKMQEDVDKYENDLKAVLGKKYSRDYVEKLSQISEIIKVGKRYQHADCKSELVNVMGGQRITIDVPEEYDRTIHVYGRCGAFGYAVEDVHTMPSQIQKLCNRDKLKIRVENHGLWGANEEKFINNLALDIEEGIIQENDIVLVYATFRTWLSKEKLEDLGVYCYDTTVEYHEFLREGHTFYDIPGHMTAEGYEFIASYVYSHMMKKQVFQSCSNAGKSHKTDTSKLEVIGEIDNYLDKVKEVLPVEDLFQGTTGAIVMNCNPFTLGHRYLVETAMEAVDHLLLFVLEEDKSYFSFADRIEMVRRGTKDLPNVYVLPSGNYMISALTFPEYFLKDQKPDAKIDATDDVQLFGRYIAPALNITVRFVGTEPIDKVTAQYNVFLKRHLGNYGVKLCEIPRLKNGKEYISASQVRRLLEAKEYEQLKMYIPDTTFQYLIENV